MQIEGIFAGVGDVEHLIQGRQKQPCTVRVTAITDRGRLNCLSPNCLLEPDGIFADGFTFFPNRNDRDAR